MGSTEKHDGVHLAIVHEEAQEDRAGKTIACGDLGVDVVKRDGALVYQVAPCETPL